ncbi:MULTISPECIES: hypothetical protein [unclassified Streptomyces]|uniref:hypothetical protein n=1 Tax=unclassified Streptomyces TaxID=2593676 RepID=UPI00381BD4A4
MNTERPDDNDAEADAARGPEDRRTPEPRTTEEPAERPADGGAETPAEPSAKGGAESSAGDGAEGAERADVAAPAEASPEPAEPEAGAVPGERPAAPEAATDEVTASTPESKPDLESKPEPESAPEAVPASGPSERPQAAEAPRTPPELAPHKGSEEADDARPRRRAPVLIASVAAAAVLVVGGGGALLAANASGGSGGGTGSGASGGDGPPPVLTLDDLTGPAAAEGRDAGTPEPGNGIAPGEPDPYGPVYRADGGLPDGPGSAPVYWAKGEVARSEVSKLADALGVTGTVVADGPAWRVGAGTDGSGPVLRVDRKAPGLWTFSRYAPGTDDCQGGIAKCAKDPVAPSADPVGEAAARKAAAPVLKAVGQDDAKIDASQAMGAQRVVNADPEVGGLPTHGWTTGVTVSGQGEIVGGSGQLKPPVEGATYPVLSAQRTLDRLNESNGSGGAGATDHRMGIGGCASPVPAGERLESPCKDQPTAAPKPRTLTVDDAVFGLAPHASGGRQVLVPSWLFSVKGAAEAYTLAYPAVEPKYLGTPPAASQPAEPPASGTEETQNVQLDGYTAEGSDLVVSYTGGVCSDYEATAVEKGDRVEVTVTATPWPDKVCIKIAKVFHSTVKLDKPLGDRTVVGTDGKNVPLEKPGARLPR